jgi:hypothetical protein
VHEAGRKPDKIRNEDNIFACSWSEGFEALRKLIRSRCSAVGKVVGYEKDDLGTSPGRVKNFHISISSRPAQGPTQNRIKWL